MSYQILLCEQVLPKVVTVATSSSNICRMIAKAVTKVSMYYPSFCGNSELLKILLHSNPTVSTFVSSKIKCPHF
jgi:hypothetical protein